MINNKIEKINFYLVIFSALFLGLLADVLFHQKPIGISFFIFNLIIIILSLVFAKRFKKKINKTQFFILISILLFSAGVFIRTSLFLRFGIFMGNNSLLAFWNIAICLYLLFLFFTLFLDKKILDFDFLDYFSRPPSFLLQSLSSASKFIEKSKKLFDKRNVLLSKDFFRVVKGIAIASPFLAVFIWLLSSADLVFQAYLDNLIEVNISPEIIPRILIILIFSCFFIGIFSKIGKHENLEIAEEKKKENKFLGHIESSTILILVELLFLIFIVIQFFYLFGGKDYVWGIAEYITYSEYAKNGFWELIKVSIISFLLIYGLDKFARKETLKEKKIFKILSVALFFEISVIIFSAVKRLSVYTDGYGLTFSRFFAFVFLFWIFSVFIIFIYKKIVLEKKEAVFLFSIFCLTIAFWAGINILNPDAFIARKNIERMTQGRELDSNHLVRLSEDAIPEITKIFGKDVDDTIKERVANDLYMRYTSSCGATCETDKLMENTTTCMLERLEEIRKAQKWQSFNFSRKKALSAIEKNSEKIVEYRIKFCEKEIIRRNNEKKNSERYKRLKEFKAPIFIKNEPDTVINSIMQSINDLSLSVKFLNPTKSSQWWISDDGWSISDSNAVLIASSRNTIKEREYFTNHTNPVNPLNPLAKELNNSISKIFLSNGFTLNALNTSKSETDNEFYDYIVAFQKDEMRCILKTNGDYGEYSVACSNSFQEAYEEQIPYLKALDERNAIVNEQERIGDFVWFRVNRRRTGFLALMKDDGEKIKLIFTGQESPFCNLMIENQVPKEVYGSCYDDSGNIVQ